MDADGNIASLLTYTYASSLESVYCLKDGNFVLIASQEEAYFKLTRLLTSDIDLSSRGVKEPSHIKENQKEGETGIK